MDTAGHASLWCLQPTEPLLHPPPYTTPPPPPACPTTPPVQKHLIQQPACCVNPTWFCLTGHDSSESLVTAPVSTSGLDEKSSGQGQSHLSSEDTKDQGSAAKPAAEEAARHKGAQPAQVPPPLPKPRALWSVTVLTLSLVLARLDHARFISSFESKFAGKWHPMCSAMDKFLQCLTFCSVKAYHKLPVVMAIAKHAFIVRFQLSAVIDVKQ